MGNPYDEFIEDEASGIKVPSELYKAWQQGAKTTAQEIKEELEKYGIWFGYYDKRDEYRGEFIRISEAVWKVVFEGYGVK